MLCVLTLRHVCLVVRHLAVAGRAHHARVVEVLRTVVRVTKVLLEVLGWFVVAVGRIVELHVAWLVGDAAPGLKHGLLELQTKLE